MTTTESEGPIRLLVLEDRPEDVELMRREFRPPDRFAWRVEASADGLRDALRTFTPDAILSDYNMQGFDALEALAITREWSPDLPFLVVTGSIGEETAVGCLRLGATDYLLKERLTRLPSAVEAALETRQHKRRAEVALAQLRIRSAALAAVPSAIVIADSDGVIEWVNPAFVDTTGFQAEEAIGTDARALRSGIHPEAFYRTIWEHLRRGETWHGQVYNRRKDGRIFLSDVSYTPVDEGEGEGRSQHIVAVIDDLTERRRQEERIRYLETVDPLTELPNRRGFLAQLEQAVAEAAAGRPCALLALDLDHFGAFNDLLGAAAGDELLRRVAGVLHELSASHRAVGRTGGDEFAVLLEAHDLAAATARAEQVRAAIEAIETSDGGVVHTLGVSGGLAWIDGKTVAHEIQALADAALDAARQSGSGLELSGDRVRVRIHQESEQARWAAQLRDALARDRLVLHYHPVVPLAGGPPDRHEVLVRMLDAQERLIGPASFLPAAERFGLAPRIDSWVIDRALAELARRPRLRLLVNLSASTLMRPELLASIRERLAQTPAVGARLTFEITESASVADLAAARGWIESLKEVGVRFALDDFGTGFASFEHLRALPFDLVKIDGSFLQGLSAHGAEAAIVRAMTDVCHALGREVIAEAVETKEVADLVRDLGVDYGQGYFWGHPVPLEELTAERP